MLPFLLGLDGVVALVVVALVVVVVVVMVVVVAGVLVGWALLLTGSTVGVLSGGPPLRRVLRQLAIGAGAAGVTYGLGLLLGAALG